MPAFNASARRNAVCLLPGDNALKHVQALVARAELAAFSLGSSSASDCSESDAYDSDTSSVLSDCTEFDVPHVPYTCRVPAANAFLSLPSTV
ncbi:hypothetical protein RI367_002727 [Sorochytrium milnesiophthora]